VRKGTPAKPELKSKFFCQICLSVDSVFASIIVIKSINMRNNRSRNTRYFDTHQLGVIRLEWGHVNDCIWVAGSKLSVHSIVENVTFGHSRVTVCAEVAYAPAKQRRKSSRMMVEKPLFMFRQYVSMCFAVL